MKQSNLIKTLLTEKITAEEKLKNFNYGIIQSLLEKYKPNRNSCFLEAYKEKSEGNKLA